MIESARLDGLNVRDALLLKRLLRSTDSLLAGLMDEVTVEPEDGDTVLWEHTISDLQADIEVEGDAITGALFYVSEGALPTTWGPGYFLALKFDDFDATATSVKVGLDPTQGSGLVELDDDKNAVFKITDRSTQRLKVVSTDGTRSTVQYFDLSGLRLMSQ